MWFSRISILALASALALASQPAAAQAGPVVPDAASAAEIRKKFLQDLDTLHSKFLALANAFPEDKYAWRPAPGVRSVGEAFMHVASEYYVFAPLAYGAARSPLIPRGPESFANFEKASTKADALKHLNEGFAYMKQQLNGLTDTQITGTRALFGRQMTIIETSFIMSGDLHEHLGQLIAYARSNGIKPPWSR